MNARVALGLALAAALAVAPAFAQHGHAPAPSPYAGQHDRLIKSLSPEDVAELRRGGGWGLAKPAELNGVPGPAHLLDAPDEIGLTPEQVGEIERIFADMRAAAVAAGERYLAAEAALEEAFRAGGPTPERLRARLAEIEAHRTELRYVHLAAHLEAAVLLSAAQIDRYNALRGYTDEPCATVPAGHDPTMWRRHQGCE